MGSDWVDILVGCQSRFQIDIDGAVPQRGGWVDNTPSRFVVGSEVCRHSVGLVCRIGSSPRVARSGWVEVVLG